MGQIRFATWVSFAPAVTGALRDAEQWERGQPVEAPTPAGEVLELILASRQAATRRQRYWVGGSLAVAVGAVGLAIYAYSQTLRATAQTEIAVAAQSAEKKQRKRAEKRERDAIAAKKAEQRQTKLAEEREREAQAARVAEEGQRKLAEEREKAAKIARAAEVEQRKVAERNEALANQEKRTALLQRSRVLASFANRAVDRGDAVTGALIAIEALEKPENVSSWIYQAIGQRALYRALLDQREKLILTSDHSDHLNARFSQDGSKILASGLKHNEVTAWDLDGRQSAKFHHPRLRGNNPLSEELMESFRQVDFLTAPLSPDGNILITGDNRGQVIFWHSGDKRRLAKFSPPLPTQYIALTSGPPKLSPDGKYAIAYQGDIVEIFNVKEGRGSSSIDFPVKVRVELAAIAPNAKYAALAIHNNKIVIWSSDEYELIKILDGHEESIKQLEFSSDGKLLISADSKGHIKAWSTEDWNEKFSLAGHTSEIKSIAFARKAEFIASASADKTARVWDLKSGKPVSVLRGHEKEVTSVGFSAGGDTVLTASEDQTVRIWNARSGAHIRTVGGHKDIINTLSVHPGGNQFLTGARDETARLWTTKPLRKQSFDAEGEVNEIALRSDSKRMLFRVKGKVSEFEFDTGERRAILETDDETIRRIGYAADRRSILVVYDDGRVEVRDETGDITAKHTASLFVEVEGAEISKDGRYVAMAADDASIYVWDLNKRDAPRELVGHEDAPNKLTFVTNNTRLLSGSVDGSSRLWDLARARQVQEFNGEYENYSESHSVTLGETMRAHADGKPPRAHLNSQALDPNEKLLVTSHGNRIVTIWDVETGEIVGGFRGLRSAFDAVRFDKSGQILILPEGGIDHSSILIADVKTLKAKGQLLGHSHSIKTSALAPAGNHLLTMSWRSVRLWDVEQRKEIITLAQNDKGFSHALFSPNGKRIIIASEKGKVTILPHYADAINMMETAKASLPRCLTPSQRRLVFLETDAIPDWCNGLWPYLAQHSLAEGDDEKQRKNYEQAIGHYDEAIRLASTDDKKLLANAYYSRGVAKDFAKKTEAARKDLQQAVNLGHENATETLWWVTNDAARNRLDSGDTTAALEIAWRNFMDIPDVVVADDPVELRLIAYYLTYPIARLYAKLAIEGGETAKPTECDLLASHAEDPFRLAKATSTKDIDVDRAITACTEAVSAKPNEPRFLLNRSRAYSSAADRARDEKDEEKASAIESKILADLEVALKLSFRGRTGYPVAANNMGYYLRHGDKRRRDRARAAEFYIQFFNHVVLLCAPKVVAHLLDSVIISGKGNTIDEVAHELLIHSAALGSERAHKMLAEYYASGRLKPKSENTTAEVIVFEHTELAEKISGRDQDANTSAMANSAIGDLALLAALDRVKRWQPLPLTSTPDWLGDPRRRKILEDLKGWRLVPQVGHANDTLSIAFSPDGALLATGSFDNTIGLWDVKTGTLVHKLVGHERSGYRWAVSSVAFSPDGKWLVSGASDNTVRVWEVATSKLVYTLRGHYDDVRSVAVSPDGRLIASGSSDANIGLWNLSDGKKVRVLTGHDKFVRSIAFSPDGKTLASGSGDKTVRLWEVVTGKQLRTLKGHENGINRVRFSPDGRQLAVGSWNKTVLIWDVSEGRLVRTLEDGSSGGIAIAYSPDGSVLASGAMAKDDHITIWDSASGQLRRKLDPDENWVRSIAISPDGALIASDARRSLIKLWRLADGKLVHTLPAHEDEVSVLAFSPDGATLATGTSGNMIHLWWINKGWRLGTLQGHQGDINAITFSPDGKRLASASEDKRVGLWNAKTGEMLHSLIGHEEEVNVVAFSPDGKILASGSAEKGIVFEGETKDLLIKLWDVESGKEVRTLKGHKESINAVVFSPDGKLIASGTTEGLVKIWQVGTGRVKHTLTAHAGSIVTDLVFSSDGKTLRSSSGQEHHFWDVNRSRQLEEPRGEFPEPIPFGIARSPVANLTAKPVASQVIVSDASGTAVARLFSLPDEQWIGIAPDGTYKASDRAGRFLRLVKGSESRPMTSVYRNAYERPNGIEVVK